MQREGCCSITLLRAPGSRPALHASGLFGVQFLVSRQSVEALA